MRKVVLAGLFAISSFTSTYADEASYSVITVYECSTVAGNRVWHPEDATVASLQERIEKEPLCQKMETFFVHNEQHPETPLHTYEGKKEGKDVVIIIHETSFSLPESDIRA